MTTLTQVAQAAAISTIPAHILNTTKTDYEDTPLFLGQLPGLFDTINSSHPKLIKLYKKLKAQDWDEQEFDFVSCKQQFKTCKPEEYFSMISTIAWQWEADTAAARSMIRIVAPFVSSSDFWSAVLRIADNEVVHARSYSEMVKFSFDDPEAVMADVLSKVEALRRMKVIAEVMDRTYQVGLKIETGEISRDSDEAYEAIFMFYVAMYCLEGLQFIASFAVTFALANMGLFVQFGKCVQKICADELEIHAEFDRAVLDIELGSERGLMFFNRNREKILQIIDDVRLSEYAWVDYLAENTGNNIPGTSPEGLKAEVDRNALPIYQFFGFKPELPHIDGPILAYMEKWKTLDEIQPAPQEEKHGAYLLGGFKHDDEDVEFELSGLMSALFKTEPDNSVMQ